MDNLCSHLRHVARLTALAGGGAGAGGWGTRDSSRMPGSAQQQQTHGLPQPVDHKPMDRRNPWSVKTYGQMLSTGYSVQWVFIN